jgi:superfamily II RNA helicase
VPPSADTLLDEFLAFVAKKGLTLYPAQEEAILEIFAGKNVILSTPTGSGKSLVAAAMHFYARALGKRSFYTCPIKALVSEKFFALCEDFGPNDVGMITGDAAVNRDAPIICCTAEILSNMALREGREADVDFVIMDEFHYYADKERGVAWQVPLLVLDRARFLLMSATLGGTEFFEETVTKLTGEATAIVTSSVRPVPLDFDYRETPLHETVLELVRANRHPIYVVCFTQRGAAEEAQNLMSIDFCTKDEKRAIADDLVGHRFDSPYGKEVQRFLRHGIGLHHAGLLPKYRLRVEKLAQSGKLKIICGTDTLGVGVNIPIRTVLFTKLCKFDGEKTAILSVRDFLQISGRAGRKGFDERGFVSVQAPEHVIENLRMEQRAAGDKAKLRKMVKKKPPDRGYVHWDKTTFDRLVSGTPEPLQSRFRVTHGMLLNVLGREDGGCRAVARLIARSHERRAAQRIHGRTAIQMFKSLLGARIIEIGEDKRVRVHADLQEDFSLHHALSLYLVETCSKIDPDREEYPLDILTLAESILENPELVLMRQVDKLKRDKLTELKAAGVEYDQRMEELEKIEHPKPNADFIYATFNDFAKAHPWVGAENIRPKSVAREMIEQYMSFGDYIKEYGLERGEGLVLRYLSDVYKTLVQTVPEWAKDARITDLVTFFGAIVRQVDSSLLDEWERMKDPDRRRFEVPPDPDEPKTHDVTRDVRAFTVLVRNLTFSLVRALAARDHARAAAILDDPEWTSLRFDQAMGAYWLEHPQIRVDARARSPENLRIDEKDGVWEITQALVAEDDEPSEWHLRGKIDLGRAREAARPVLALEHLGT